MKIISSSKSIDLVLVRLMEKYNKYYIATAWASPGSKASKKLLENKDNIVKMVVGTHFHQTHPDFIKDYIDNESVRFILNPSGVFHPKVYLFYHDVNDWECILGSANFTKSALTKNSEIVVHIKSSDGGVDKVYNDIVNTINSYWVNADVMDSADLAGYRSVWERDCKAVDKLSEKYGGANPKKSLMKSVLFTSDWSKYYSRIIKDKYNSFDRRLELLEIVKGYFSKVVYFSELTELQRREVAGIATQKQSNSNVEWGWFGSMTGAGKFQNRINKNNPFISKSLDKIPLLGEVRKEDYEQFVRLFCQAFPDGGAGVAIASRLLAMKRPDYFVCLDTQNKSGLCDEFGISRKVSFDGYWDDIVERIIDSVWWNSKEPKDDFECKVWHVRVAMLDSIYYKEE
ncbi:MAG: phospholipase D family protein [Gammaproteobacteria bacterium]|nr:phospholipase D family protein [Gammaproteobacteria bacterium]